MEETIVAEYRIKMNEVGKEKASLTNVKLAEGKGLEVKKKEAGLTFTYIGSVSSFSDTDSRLTSSLIF